MKQPLTGAELKFFTMDHGEEFVVMAGTLKTLE